MKTEAEFTVRRSLRISKEQDEQIASACQESGMSFSAYIRLQLDNRPVAYLTTKEDRMQRAALITEINRIGININQIVKNVNSFFYSKEEKKELFELLQKVYGLLEEKVQTAERL